MGEERKRMGFANKFVVLTVSMVVLAGILSAGATVMHTRRVSDAYDLARQSWRRKPSLTPDRLAAARGRHHLVIAGGNEFLIAHHRDVEQSGAAV